MDHPVIKRLVKNLSINFDSWSKAVPEVIEKPTKKHRVEEWALAEEQELGA
ncbi:hypothetical protein RMSM_00088 [Rhodopirellula maiorica SM1]|uniref:Uncharacterized protein n=1 Tax=Rhodopirellula maiorica SM1 TaxID=1265738 RepID=M5RUF8_9BACT|nr:hypothetical protein [Rhodopirellula maiorica]EMI22978.1 hypothetical protein RMSM_00088 [Rhodopirellula maiorica SM1]